MAKMDVQRSGSSRPGGRTARTREAVHAAARELMSKLGAEHLTIPAVADRAGVHATTVYRRWQTAEALLLDVLAEDIAAQAPLAVTGDLHADILRYARSLAIELGRPGGLAVVHALLATAQTHPGGVAAARAFAEPRSEQIAAILTASHTTEISVNDIFELVVAPIVLWAALGAIQNHPTATDQDAVRRLADNVIAIRDARARR
ncbi:TetR/AcrR family transcriptional regulator [Microbacterium marinilacus]|uniref:HTH tetR-type domain-containing protein n=1 Tax=Microbacterium marinilacus TaxID=415209 RepID=A0ABP7BSL1_9MICO|nr:TetR/AcrR family transcriptional regulator [Microbacterium marinilacus]MBY0690475.1 TetR/AcrR family transcriptional regulator [Microbacterium marinilacus]